MRTPKRQICGAAHVFLVSCRPKDLLPRIHHYYSPVYILRTSIFKYHFIIIIFFFYFICLFPHMFLGRNFQLLSSLMERHYTLYYRQTLDPLQQGTNDIVNHVKQVAMDRPPQSIQLHCSYALNLMLKSIFIVILLLIYLCIIQLHCSYALNLMLKSIVIYLLFIDVLLSSYWYIIMLVIYLKFIYLFICLMLSSYYSFICLLIYYYS